MEKYGFFIITAFMIFACLCISSCWFMCVDAQTSPAKLIKDNEYVFLGKCIAVDTISNLGTLEYLGAMEDAYIIEYTLEPIEVFKGDKQANRIFLWYCVTIRKKDNYSNAPKLKVSAKELVYGNCINSPADYVHILTPNLVTSETVQDLELWLKGIKPEQGWAAKIGDSTIASRIMTSDTLNLLLNDRKENGYIIYGTDPGYYTHYSFHDGKMVYCNPPLSVPQFVSREQYLKKLRSWAD